MSVLSLTVDIAFLGKTLWITLLQFANGLSYAILSSSGRSAGLTIALGVNSTAGRFSYI